MRLAILICLWLLVSMTARAQPAADLDALEARALAAFSAGKTAEAIDLFQQVRAGRHAANAPALEARALFRLAVGYRGQGKTAAAVRACREGLEIATRSNADAMVAEILAQLYQLGTSVPAFPDAKTQLDEALRRARLANEPRTLARTYDTRARWLGNTGRLDAAIDEVNEGLSFARAAGDSGLITSLYSLRSIFGSRGGNLGEALADALLSRDAAAKVGPRAEVQALFTLAQVHAHLSNFDESARLWTDVIDRYRQIGPPIGVALALDSRSHVWYELGRDDLCLADVREALAVHEALQQRPSAALYSRAALASIRQNQIRDGERWLAEAERRLPAGPDFEQIQTMQQLGMARLMLGDAPAAHGVYTRMLEAGRRRNSLEDEWKAQFGLGRAALVAHAPDVAAVHLEVAARTIETLRTTVPAQELRAAYLARRVEAHEWLAAALMTLSKSPTDSFVEAAFNVAERARVRALADLLAEGRSRRTANHPLIAPPRARTRVEMAAALGPRDALIEYLVGEQHAFAWLLTRDELIGFRLPSPKSLDTDVRLALALIESDDRAGLRELGDRLTPALLGPLLSRLPQLRRILVVPDGPLQRLPFAALPVPGIPSTYLAQHVVSSTVGSGSLLEMLDRNTTGRWPLLALSAGGGSSPSQRSEPTARASGSVLRETSGEISDAMRLLDTDGTSRSMRDATELAIKTDGIADYRVIHIAAHSVVDEAYPRNSAVMLGLAGTEDGELRASEISQLRVNANLVVLAACRTQLGRILRGEGLLSLARSFMEAGAQAVVASLWDVGDRDTRVLMRGFYSGIRAGLSPDEALRVTQLQMIRAGGELAAPKAWASFQVSGEGRRAVFPRASVSMAGLSAAGGLIAGLVVICAALSRKQTNAD
jgi:CHAT domain-containing protein